MKRLSYIATTAALLCVFALIEHVTQASARATFMSMAYVDHREFSIACAARLECDIQLQPGERVNDGFNAHITEWDPHIGYVGSGPFTPHLVLRPSRAGLHTNIILTTTRRTYYLNVSSTDDSEPTYYNFTYNDDVYSNLAKLAVATQTALRAQGGGPAASLGASDLKALCIDNGYTTHYDGLPADHPPHTRTARGVFPPEWTPQLVCNDGKHTFIQMPALREQPADNPTLHAITADGDTLINFTYDRDANRYIADGIYDSLVLQLGSQDSPLRLRIDHSGHSVMVAPAPAVSPTPAEH